MLSLSSLLGNLLLILYITSASAVIVTTNTGPVEGSVIDNAAVFMGIPYAQPPINNLRFAPPKPANNWTEPLQALNPKPACIQIDTANEQPVAPEEQSEDCLYLNIYAPEDAIQNATKKPVMLWIHGGALRWGYSHYYVYDGKSLATNQDVIVVTFNYRLNLFGFFAANYLNYTRDGQQISGNWGFLDQQLLLKWVHENIAYFGGDPERVTIFGWSAGSYSVCAHLTTPGSWAYFSGAIMQSGSCIEETPLSSALASSLALPTALGCDLSGDLSACVRGATTSELLSVLSQPENVAIGFAATVVDGVIFPASSAAAVRTGQYKNIPVIAGNTANEAAWGLPLYEAQGPIVWPALPGFTQLLYGSFERGSEMAEFYTPADYNDPVQAGVMLATDYYYICSGKANLADFGRWNTSLYYYIFSQNPSWGPENWGAYHQSDMWYIFGNPKIGFNFTAEEAVFTNNLQTVWANYARDFNPLSEWLTMWPFYRDASQQFVSLSTVGPIIGRKYRQRECNGYNEVVGLVDNSNQCPESPTAPASNTPTSSNPINNAPVQTCTPAVAVSGAVGNVLLITPIISGFIVALYAMC